MYPSTRHILSALVAGTIAFGLCFWLLFGEYEHRRMTSPDGSWTVTVVGWRVEPYVKNVRIVARFTDTNGNIIGETDVDTIDDWCDTETLLPDLRIGSTRCQMGSGFGTADEDVVMDFRKP